MCYSILGKSHFILQCLKYHKAVFDCGGISQLVYCYGVADNKALETIRSYDIPRVRFVEGWTEEIEKLIVTRKLFDNSIEGHRLLILDDRK